MIIQPTISQTLGYYKYTTNTFGVSVRKLKDNYTGSCLRVRRSSDDAEQDIGFVSGYLDENSLSTFVGTGAGDIGYVVKWYNQGTSGSALDAIQTTTANQPTIVEAGAILKVGDKACIRFLDTSAVAVGQYLDIGGVYHAAADQYVYVFSVLALAGAGSFPYVIGSNPAPRGFLSLFNGTTRNVRAGTARTATTAGDGTRPLTLNYPYQHTWLCNRTRIQVCENGSYYCEIDIADTNTNFSMPTSYWIGNTNAVAIQSNTLIQEIICFNSDQSSNRRNIETSQRIYFKI
jgi:hypothetical protein